MNVNYSFRFRKARSGSGNKNELGTIQMVCYQNLGSMLIDGRKPKKRLVISTKVRIKEEFWNENKREVKRKHPQCDHLNNLLQELKKQYREFEERKVYELRGSDQVFTLDMFDEIKTLDDKYQNNFVAFIETEIKRREKSGKFSIQTIKNYNTFHKLISEDFRKRIAFREIGMQLGKELEEFLSIKTKSYRWSIEKNLKTFLGVAKAEGLINANAFEAITKFLNTPKVNNQDKQSLTMEEVKKIIRHNPKSFPQQCAKDAFLISCFTGLRISDVLNKITFENLEEDKEYGLILKVNVQKNSSRIDKKPLRLPVGVMFKFSEGEKSEPEKILRKYAELKRDLIDTDYPTRNFFDLSPQYVNRYLKTLKTTLKLQPEKLTFHIGRHTFASLMHHHFGHSIGQVQMHLQHSNIKTTMVYEKTSEIERFENLKKTNWNV